MEGNSQSGSKREREYCCRKSNREEGRKKEDLGLREEREKGDLGAKGRIEKRDWGQRRGNERQGAFPHQIRSDGPN